jgi:hypothetical protein
LTTPTRRESLAVLYVIFNNGTYRILKQRTYALKGFSAADDPYVGMDLDRPRIDFVGMAGALGVPGERVDKASDVGSAIGRGLTSRGPYLVDVSIDPTFKQWCTADGWAQAPLRTLAEGRVSMRPLPPPRWRFMNCCGHAWGHGEAALPAERGRRDFLKAAVAGVAGLATVGRRGDRLAAQVPAFPPPPPAESPIEGLIDFHNHSAPDVFGRSVDDDESAPLYMARKMEAIVLKNHVATTADRAWLARKHNPGVKAFGGITLNGAAGGLNPDAVQWMWRMQGGYGRVVWLPTFDADHHVKHFKDAPEGVKVVGPHGKALPALREIAKICAQQELVLGTGHASPTEVLAIIEAARDAGCDRIVVTHAEFDVVNMTTEQMKRAAAMGAKLEIDAIGVLMGPDAHLPWMRHWRRVTYKESAGHIKDVGAQHFVLGTDLGQMGNPSQPDGYAMLVAGLMAEGIVKDQIELMGRETPGALLMG